MSVCVSVLSLPRINGQLVALKVISMNAEEGVPFTAIREGKTRKKRTSEVVLIARRGKTEGFSLPTQHAISGISRCDIISNFDFVANSPRLFTLPF